MRTADKMAATRENCTALAPAVPKLSLHLSVAQLQLLVFWKKCIKRILTYNLNLEYLKIRICWGGGAKFDLPPPLEFPCLMSKYAKWYIIGKLLCSTFRICKKMQICKIWNFLEYPFNKMFAKNVQKRIKYTSLKSPSPCHSKYAKKFANY